MRSVDVAIISTNGDPHAEAVISWLRQSDSSVVTLNLGTLRSNQLRVTSDAVKIRQNDSWHHLDATTTVWWHRPGHTPTEDLATQEAELVRDENPHVLIGMLDGCGVRWVDHPDRVARAERKLFQLAAAHRSGVSVPPYLLTNDPSAATDFMTGRRVVTKALSPGFGIAPFTTEVTNEDAHAVATNPVLLQELIDATADLRVVVVNENGWVWSRTRSPDMVDWRAVDPSGGRFAPTHDPTVVALAIELTRTLGLSMSIQDWLATKERPVFLENNAQGAWRFLPGSQASVGPALAHHLGRYS